MYPVSVKQIMEASPSIDDKSNFLIDGVGVYNVRFLIISKLVYYDFSVSVSYLNCEEI